MKKYFSALFLILYFALAKPAHAISLCPRDVGGDSASFNKLCDIAIGDLVGTAVSFIFFIAIIAALFYLVWGGFKWLTSGGDITINPVGGMPSGGITVLYNIFGTAISVLFVFVIILCLFVLIYSGWLWITSGGDKQKLQQIRQRMIYALIGLVITLLSFSIMNLLGDFFGIDILS